MKKQIVLLGIILISALNIKAQTPKIYDPLIDGEIQLQAAISKAKAEQKHVFVMVGGNWCKWCLAFDKMVNNVDSVNTFLNNNYVVVHLNYSKENKNLPSLAKLGYPQRFGFPVFVILDQNGSRLHTQNSGYLEEGEGHDPNKVYDFFKSWTTKSIDPKSYTSK